MLTDTDSADGPVRFRILGPVEASVGSSLVAFSSSKLRTVLGLLLIDASRVVSDARFTEMLWGEHPPNTVSAQIQTYVSRLRQRLSPGIEIIRQPPGYLLRVAADDVDLRVFEKLAARGRAALDNGAAETAAETLREALAIWRGPALSGVSEFLADAERPRLEEARLSAVEDRIAADLLLGSHAMVVPELTGLVRAHPLRERLRAQLMIALYGSGRQAEALEAFAEYRHTLAEELGIDPGPELNDLRDQILAAERDLVVPRAAAQRLTATGPESVLPAAPPDFVGRRAELTRLNALFDDATGDAVVCVISGMPAVGKSALALCFAHRLAARPRLYLDLRQPDGSAMPAAMAVRRLLSALGVGEDPGDSDEQRLRRYQRVLAAAQAVVVLDNATDERQVRPLLPTAAGCAAVVTARSPLVALDGVRTVELGPLETAEATELLGSIIGARRLSARGETESRIAWLCGCLPLAVRIAGARLVAQPHWSLDRLADRLSDRHRRLDELTVADLDLRAVLMSAYHSVDEQARRTFRLLALPDAEEITAWTAAALADVDLGRAADLLDQLVYARLLVARRPVGGRQSRYRLPELMRVLAMERAGAEETAAARRAALYRLVNA